ncbi:MAG: HD domain-containing protein, partial [Desulfobacteraceae bacterium]
ELKKCRQNQFHEFNAFTHTMMALFALENILTRFDYILQLEENTNPNKNLIKQPELLKFSLLLHDIGKLETNTTGADGKPHFYGHAKVGATKADTIARRLALSNNQRNYITLIIGNHLTPSFLFSEYQSSTLNDRVIVRLFRKTKAFTPDLLLHSMADFLGKKCRDNSSILAQPFIIFIRDLLEKYCFSFVPIQKKPSLLSGRDLIQYFDLSPSPFFKIILEAVEEQRLTGQLISKTEALKWTKSYLKQLRGQYGS